MGAGAYSQICGWIRREGDEMSMSWRDRVLTGMVHEEPYRLPLSIGACVVNALLQPTCRRLKDRFGITARPPACISIRHQFQAGDAGLLRVPLRRPAPRRRDGRHGNGQGTGPVRRSLGEDRRQGRPAPVPRRRRNLRFTGKLIRSRFDEF